MIRRADGVRHFAIDEHGGSLVEYALLAGIVAAMLFFVSEGMTSVVGDALDEAAVAVHGEVDRGDVGSSSAAPRSRPTGEMADAARSTARRGAASSGVRRAWLLILAISAAGLAWRLRCRDVAAARQRSDAAATSDSAACAAIFEKRQQLLRAMVGDLASLHDGAIEVRQLMSRCPATVSAETPVSRCAEQMSKRNFRHLLVCDEDGSLLGIISDRDLARQSGAKAADIMTKDPQTVRPDSDVCPAITIMLRRRISSLPVVENGRLVGLLTTTDLLLALQCALQALEKSAAPAVCEPAPAARRISDCVPAPASIAN